MWEAIGAYAGAFKWHTGLLVTALIVFALLAMVWRRKGARHVAQRYGNQTPMFNRALSLANRALWFTMGITLLQEVAAFIWQVKQATGK